MYTKFKEWLKSTFNGGQPSTEQLQTIMDEDEAYSYDTDTIDDSTVEVESGEDLSVGSGSGHVFDDDGFKDLYY